MDFTTLTDSQNFFLKTLFQSAFGLVGFVLGLVGAVFFTLAMIFWIASAASDIPMAMAGTFALMGGLLLVASLPMLWRTWQKAQKTAVIFQNGLRTNGNISQLTRNYAVRVNRRHPWLVRYQYQIDDILFEGEQNVWDLPAADQQKTAVVVYYDPLHPSESRIQ